MRKRIQGRTLSRNMTQRKALKRTMLVSLVNSEGGIRTTLAKAKELKPFAERMITRAKKVKDNDKNSLAVIIRQLKKDVTTETAKKLITIAKNYKSRNGGYLRIVKLAPRKSDSAEIAMLQWVNLATGGEEIAKNKKTEDKKLKGKNKSESINNKSKADQSESGKSDK